MISIRQAHASRGAHRASHRASMEDLLTKEKDARSVEFSAVSVATVLFVVSLIAAFLTAGAFGGLTFLARTQGEAHAEITEQVREKEQELRSDLLRQITTLDSRLKNIRTLLIQHPFNSNVLRVIERTVHPQVRFKSFHFAAQSRKLDMDGEAPAYRIVTRQIELFERDSNIERVEFGGLGSGAENRITFKISLVFKPDILRLAP